MMRRVTAILSVGAVVLMAAAAGVAAQAKPNFAGEWKKAGAAGSGGQPGVDLTITQSDTAMTVEYRAGRETPAPAKLTYQLDGSGSKWAANKLVVTTKTSAGEEKRTFSMEGGDLVVETSTPARAGVPANTTKVTYQKYQRGHGG